jgi:hypothetical protein
MMKRNKVKIYVCEDERFTEVRMDGTVILKCILIRTV